MNGGREAQAVLGLTGRPFQEALAINRASTRRRWPACSSATATRSSKTLDDPAAFGGGQRRLMRDVFFICPLLGVLRADDLVPGLPLSGGRAPAADRLAAPVLEGAVTATLNRAP